MTEKGWGDGPFWGLGFEWDPQWLLTPAQLQLQAELIALSETTLRPNAVESDKGFVYPRKNFEALAAMGLLGLLVPKELGGRGESHLCAAMVVETIARYGCPSTAMCYTMHLGATAAALFRHHHNPLLTDILRRLDEDVLIGTLSYSDPETGSHFWYPVSSSAARHGEGWLVNKKASWTTSGGFADWYIVQTTSPDFGGNYADLSCFLVTQVENAVLPKDAIVGPVGDGPKSNDECVDPFFLICSSACWNGIAMAAIDIAKNHVTRKVHSDVGLRVADYPTIQDYVGEAIMASNASRALTFQMAQALDRFTQDCDWSIHEDIDALPRAALLHQLWQTKFVAAKNVAHVVDKMLHACGGTGYKPFLGIERLLRDGKAGWVMGPTNEVLRQFVGKAALLGFESLDYWNQTVNERVLNNEIRKLDEAGRRRLAQELLGADAARKVA